jgi:hypothetical protein
MSDRRSPTDAPQEIDLTDSPTRVGELFSRLTDQFTTLMRQEVALAKTELKAEAKKAGKAGGLFGAAGFAGYMTVILLSFAAVWGLAEVVPTGWAFLAVGVLYGVITAVLGLMGKKEAQKVDPTPHATVDTVREDAQWAREQRPR